MRILIAFLFSICTFGASSQVYWSLEQCIEHALSHNLQIRQSVLQTELSEENLKSARGAYYPTLNAFGTNTFNFGQTIDPFTNQFATTTVRSNQFGLRANMTLFNGMRNVNNAKSSQLALEASRYDLDQSRNDISLAVANAYLSVLFAEELLYNANNQLQLTKKQVNRNKTLFDAGSIPKSDLLTIQAQQATEELNVVNAENQVNLAYLSLKQFIQLDSIPNLRVIKPNLKLSKNISIASTPGQIYDQALRVMPQIKSAESRMIGADKSLAASKALRYPNLSLNGNIGSGYSGLRSDFNNPILDGQRLIGTTESGEGVFQPNFTFPNTMSFGDQLSENFNQSLGITLSIPIFNGFQANTSISQAKISREISENNVEIAKNQINQDIQRAYADARAALKQYRASQKAKESLAESFKYMEQRFNVGMINSVNYNNAKVSLSQAESNVLQAKYDFIFKSKILDFYQGKPITLK